VTRPQVALDDLHLVSLQRMRPGVTAFQSMYDEAKALEVEVVFAQQPDLARTQAMTIGKQEERTVAPCRRRSL
jgi:hypothetical protein